MMMTLAVVGVVAWSCRNRSFLYSSAHRQFLRQTCFSGTSTLYHGLKKLNLALAVCEGFVVWFGIKISILFVPKIQRMFTLDPQHLILGCCYQLEDP